MGDLTKNLSRSEFACQCGCGFDTVDYELAIVIQDIRDNFGEAVHINSGCRCEIHNKAQGGTSGSLHTMGRAADIRVNNTPSDLIYDYLDNLYPDKYGIGRYSGRTHIDTRKYKARWDNR